MAETKRLSTSDLCSYSDTSATGAHATVCFSCRGTGFKMLKGVTAKKTCNPCKGTGIISRSRSRQIKNRYAPPSYPSFETIGPLPATAIEEIQLQSNEELSFLTGHWRIIQTIDDHRYSSDDLLTAYIACKEYSACHANTAHHCNMLDMGCGLGSILLMFAWQVPASQCLGIEAQVDRFKLATRSIEVNVGKENQRVKVLHQDLRDFNPKECKYCKEEMLVFDVITGSPPYFKGHLLGQPGSFQSAGCIFELRGGVEEYCAAAYRIMTGVSNGQANHPSIFIVCNTALSSDRVYTACGELGLSVLKRVDIVPKRGRSVLICIFVLTLPGHVHFYNRNHGNTNDVSANNVDRTCTDNNNNGGNGSGRGKIIKGRAEGSIHGEQVEVICIREEDNQHTEEYCHILSSLGKPSSKDREIYDI